MSNCKKKLQSFEEAIEVKETRQKGELEMSEFEFEENVKSETVTEICEDEAQIGIVDLDELQVNFQTAKKCDFKSILKFAQVIDTSCPIIYPIVIDSERNVLVGTSRVLSAKISNTLIALPYIDVNDFDLDTSWWLFNRVGCICRDCSLYERFFDTEIKEMCELLGF